MSRENDRTVSIFTKNGGLKLFEINHAKQGMFIQYYGEVSPNNKKKRM